MMFSIFRTRFFITVFLVPASLLAGMAQDLQATGHDMENGVQMRQPGIADLDTSWAYFKDGSVRFSSTTFRLLQDAEFRNSVYPKVYTLMSVPDQLKQYRIAFALWTLINTSDKRPVDVMEIVYKLSRIGIRSQHYLQAFYTYAFSDPEVYDFGEDGITLMRPLLLEEKLDRCKNLMALSDKYMKMSLVSD